MRSWSPLRLLSWCCREMRRHLWRTVIGGRRLFPKNAYLVFATLPPVIVASARSRKIGTRASGRLTKMRRPPLAVQRDGAARGAGGVRLRGGRGVVAEPGHLIARHRRDAVPRRPSERPGPATAAEGASAHVERVRLAGGELGGGHHLGCQAERLEDRDETLGLVADPRGLREE